MGFLEIGTTKIAKNVVANFFVVTVFNTTFYEQLMV